MKKLSDILSYDLLLEFRENSLEDFFFVQNESHATSCTLFIKGFSNVVSPSHAWSFSKRSWLGTSVQYGTNGSRSASMPSPPAQPSRSVRPYE